VKPLATGMDDFYEICYQNKYTELVGELNVHQENIIKQINNTPELNAILELNNQTTVDATVEIKPKDREELVIRKVLRKQLPISNKEFYQKTLDLFDI
jgi:hypothetical protein